MANPQLQFKLVTPSQEKVSVAVDEVMLPGENGCFGVLPGHTPFLTRIGTGEVMYRIANKKHYLAISGGFVEVGDDTVIVLARVCELPEEIDKQRADEARQRAEERLKGKSTEVDFARAQAALQRAMVRLQVGSLASS